MPRYAGYAEVSRVQHTMRQLSTLFPDHAMYSPNPFRALVRLDVRMAFDQRRAPTFVATKV